MNLLDIAILALFGLFCLSGFHRGFLCSLLSLGAYLLCAALAFLFLPLLSGAVKSHETLYNTMLYYTEGEEFVMNVNVELSRVPVASVSTEQLNGVMQSAGVPHPIGERIVENIATEAFAEEGISTLGEYFNRTIVSVFINILAFLALFALFRAFAAFVIHGIEYARGGYPVLHMADGLIGSGLGLIRGFLAAFIVFMLAPPAMVVLPDLAGDFIAESFFGGFFYNSNFLLMLIPGT